MVDSDGPSDLDEPTAFMGDHPEKNKIEEAAWIEDVADRVNCWLLDGIPKTERVEIVKLVPKKYKTLT